MDQNKVTFQPAVMFAQWCTRFHHHGLLPAGKLLRCSSAATKQGRETDSVTWKMGAQGSAPWGNIRT